MVKLFFLWKMNILGVQIQFMHTIEIKHTNHRDMYVNVLLFNLIRKS